MLFIRFNSNFKNLNFLKHFWTFFYELTGMAKTIFVSRYVPVILKFLCQCGNEEKKIKVS